MDDQTFKEFIIRSPSAARMIDTVSPIYEDAYAGCWLFEDIGREWDRLWDILYQLPEQLFPQTATWMLGLWERRYGIVPNPGDSIETRRQRIEEIESFPKPFTPWMLDRWCRITMGRGATVIDNVDTFTFGVCITSYQDSGPLDIEAVRKYINSHKHSHMSYTLTYQAEDKILIGIDTAYWRFPYQFAGTRPYRNVVSAMDERNIILEPDPHGFPFDYILTGKKQRVTTTASSQQYRTVYIPCGVVNAGGGIL